MKKIISVFSFFLWPFITQAQTGLYSNGGSITLNPGAVMQVNGNFYNDNVSALQLNGELSITGNITNNQFMNALTFGTLKLNGTTPQQFQGTEALRVNNVEIDNPNGITLNNRLLVIGEAKFINGIITANDYTQTLQFSETATISNTFPPSNTCHVNGWVQKYGTGSFVYPVGDGTQYQKVAVDLSTNNIVLVAKYNAANAGAGNFTNAGTEATPLVAYNNAEYWDIIPFGNVTGTVTLFWDNYNNAGISDISILKVGHKVSGDWLNEGTTGIGSPANGSVTSNAISTWGPLALGSINQTPLPVTLLSFVGRTLNDQHLLQWTTSSEQNNHHFVLQRSHNALNFENIATIDSKAPHGNSQVEITYQYTDKLPLKGPNYYRLQQVDIDGKTHFSEIISLSNDQFHNELYAYPNPVKNVLVVESITNHDIALMNAVGQVILKSKMEPYGDKYKTKLNFSDLATGLYYLKAGDEILKIIK